jgi:glycosyltransferase involved in cell wall biosynthesis
MDVIIIPARDEQNHISQVISKTKPFMKNIIVVDDGSTDKTFDCAKEAGAITLRHRVNLGKGAALKTGCEYALKQGATKIVVMDADGQHNPKEIPLFLAALDNHDIAFGVRKVPKNMPGVLKFGNGVINNTLSLLYNIKIEDSQCGYRAFTAGAYANLKWEARDYFVETEMIIKAGKRKLKYISLPIETIYADRYKGTTVLDGVLIVAKMFGGKVFK